MNYGLMAVAFDALAVAETLAIVFRHRANGGGLHTTFGAINAVAIHEMAMAVAIAAVFPAIGDARMWKDAMNFVAREAMIPHAAVMESAYGRETI